MVKQNKVFDKTLPEEETALLSLNGGLIVFAFNGVDVKKSWYGNWARANKRIKVRVPAGEAEIEFDIVYTVNNGYTSTTYTAKDQLIKYNLEAGKKYIISFARKGGFLGFGSKMGVSLYEDRKEIEFWEIHFR
ncbi:MAG: hypothetical protein Ta2B_30110 [Termitinemataceae bacterium]|nr:MAG: hypothetical protein Ta2B_30110 [Termitinemataceae bacterium]